jgi:hypothetical protein
MNTLRQLIAHYTAGRTSESRIHRTPRVTSGHVVPGQNADASVSDIDLGYGTVKAVMSSGHVLR